MFGIVGSVFMLIPLIYLFIKRIPLNRIGKVSEITAVVRLLSSKGGSYITGQNIKVDGGITRSV